jgi:CBS domain containing-hemolysin-like protein
MAFQLFLTFFLVLLNGFFVAAEFAIVKVRTSQIEVKSGKSKGLAAAAKAIVNNLDAYLAATQLGITLASLGLGWVGEEVMTEIMLNMVNRFGGGLSEVTAHRIAVPVAFFLITVLHIVFGELAPKSLAIRYPTSTTFSIAWPLRVFYLIFRPLIWLLNNMANMILRIFGIRTVHGSEIHSEEELKMIITESHEGGAIEQTERELIQNVFDFDDRHAGDVQTLRKNITAMPASYGVKEALDFALREGYSRYPVYEGTIDEITGIINTKDLMKCMLDPATGDSIQPLIRPAYFVSDNRKIKDLLKALQLRRTVMAIVTNEIGEVSGIVTVEDILEELVGEIQDEYDDEVPYVQKTPKGTYIIDAHRKLGDINKYIPERLEEDNEYETLAGYIAYHFPENYRKGSVLRIKDYEVTILTMYRNSAATVEFRVVEDDEEE